jgi:manganese/zinc/iron transport system permease protein
MNPGSILPDLWFDYTLRTVALGTASLGAVAGALGVFAVLRRQSLLGDAIAHSALPGIGLAFLLTGSRATPILLLGAAVAGWLGTLAILTIMRTARLPADTALGVVLSVFFGAGLVLLTLIQRQPNAAQAGLETFLFGQAATLLARDVQWIAGVGAVVLGLLWVFWKEFSVLAFDAEFAATMGLPVRALDLFLTSLLVAAIVLGLQAVGVVLMSALVVAPAAAARQWTDSLARMVRMAAAFGALSGLLGTLGSAAARGLPTGPMIVLVATGIVGFSLLFAPNRGMIAGWVRHRRIRAQVQADSVLADLYALAAQHPQPDHPHAVETLRAMAPHAGDVAPSLEVLAQKGWAAGTLDGRWAITPAGAERARTLFYPAVDEPEGDHDRD